MKKFKKPIPLSQWQRMFRVKVKGNPLLATMLRNEIFGMFVAGRISFDTFLHFASMPDVKLLKKAKVKYEKV